jgi:tyrosinase
MIVPNGSPVNISGSCPTTGPFAGIRPSLGPGYSLVESNPHCVQRNIEVELAESTLGWTANVLPLLKNTLFANFSRQFDYPTTGAQLGIHRGGHAGVSGEVWPSPFLFLSLHLQGLSRIRTDREQMVDVWSSINDPLFFLHHAQLDRVWWMWQSLNPSANLWAIGGRVYPNGTGEVTLDYPVQMSPFTAPDTTVRAVMDTLNRDGSGPLCYVYELDPRLWPVLGCG